MISSYILKNHPPLRKENWLTKTKLRENDIIIFIIVDLSYNIYIYIGADPIKA